MKVPGFLLFTALVLCAPCTHAHAQAFCEPLSYFNATGTEHVVIQNMPTVWWGVRMTPLPYDADVDSAYISFGITKNNTPLQYDSLQVRILADTLPLFQVLDTYKAAIPPSFSGTIPDDYWVVELDFSLPVARLTNGRSFWLSWRLLGPAADEARIRMLIPAANQDRSHVINANGTTTRVSNYLRTGSFRDSVDLWAEARVCYPNGRTPVELMTFTASYRDAAGVLEWITANETANFGFEIERADSRSEGGTLTLWRKLGFVNGHGSTTLQNRYTFVDEHPESVMDEQGVVRYRLRQIDYDGHVSPSHVAELQIPVSASSVQLFQNYPNPVEGAAASTRISFSLPDTREVRIELFDLLGRPVMTLADRLYEAGRHTLDIGPGRLAAGSYIYTLTSGSLRLTRRLSVLD